MGDPEPPLGEPALAAGEPELALGEPALAAGDPELAFGDPALAIGDPECVDDLVAALVVPGAAVLPALLPVPELHAARITVAPAISTAAAVLTGPTGLTGLACLTDLTCDCLIMRLWSPPDGTSTSPAAGEIAADTAGRRAVHARRPVQQRQYLENKENKENSLILIYLIWGGLSLMSWMPRVPAVLTPSQRGCTNS